MHALPLRPQFAWLEITGFCNLACRHCYAGSSPQGDHGTMTDADWCRVLDELHDLGVRDVQFIGGEPTLHPGLPALIHHARRYAMRVEVFSNLTHVREPVWDALRLPGVRLAVSYYSDDPADHDEVTETPGSHARARANLRKARQLGIPVRGSVIHVLDGQRAKHAEHELLSLGIRDVRTDTIRPFGRGAEGALPDLGKLCGRCGRGKVAVGPGGDVWPCVFARWMKLGNVHETSLAAIYDGEPMRTARAELEQVFPHTAVSATPVCNPDCNPAFDTCAPQLACAPDAAYPPTEDGEGAAAVPRLSPRRTVRYHDPSVSGTDC
ncbi:radical SAM protein [Streptomyces sp. B1866]|uniref:radical SAM protein n=1 Tax=Streptomyces sp. B1866 TaxID=3075431 RepID=UPI002891EB32|nr:radical SAM protein [Streptomyces sp. B1866]MDT3396448.1 radical SAM protein [Streptomyces sp. B1866]